jgi:hypothetical protein
VTCCSAQQKLGAASIALYCQMTPLVGASEAADAEAVHLQELAGMIDLDVALEFGLARQSLGRRREAGEQRVAQRPGPDGMPAQDAVDAVGGDAEAAPLLAGELARDVRRPVAGMHEGDGDDALLDE